MPAALACAIYNARRHMLSHNTIRITYLDVQNLDFARKLEDLVLDLADLERVSISARRSVDLGVEVVRLSRFGRLAHVVHGLEDVGGDGGEVDVVEGVNEHRVRLRLCIARDAVADLELRVATSSDE